MPVITSIRYNINSAQTPIFEQAMAEIAECARKNNESLRWTTGQIISGQIGCFVLVIPSETVAEAAAIEDSSAFLQRIFSQGDAERLLTQFGEAIQSSESQILTDRAELSYPREDLTETIQAAVVTRLIVKPGGREAVEELLRKVAESIPKTDDVRRFSVYQPVIGDLREIVAVRPIIELTELDQAMSIEELLRQAFGVSEGGLVFRGGMEALESLTSELLRVRLDLSNTEA